jgi:hypothetical protein
MPHVEQELQILSEHLSSSSIFTNGRSFSTKDRDNDTHTGNCAKDRHAAWWFRNCDYANLNGLYNDNAGSGPYWWYVKQ